MIDYIMEEVKKENVIQIVIDNAANYKVIGTMIMEKRNKLYIRYYVQHTILILCFILENFEKKTMVHHKTISKFSLISFLQHFNKR